MSNSELQAKCEKCSTIYNSDELLKQVVLSPDGSGECRMSE